MSKKENTAKKAVNKNIQKKYLVQLPNKFNISGQMYEKGIHSISREDFEYLKNSPFKNKVKFLEK